jgi:pantoate--beta-alanine ligase
MPTVVTTRVEVRHAIDAARARGLAIGLVPTMGALHAGHLSLVEASRRECDFTVVTIFVNPTQFGPGEDFEQYPRDLENDLKAMSRCGVDLVFAPGGEEVYRPPHDTTVTVGDVARRWEGASRPDHFPGVATVVLKLFNIVRPDVAFFGQKDFQQTCVVRRMVEDLDLDVAIRVCPIVREADGLAMSSRNRYLTALQRSQALVLSRSLQRASQLVEEGQRDRNVIYQAIQQKLAEQPSVEVDYIAVVDPQTLCDVQSIQIPTLAALAARVGQTRLIDNHLLGHPWPTAGGLSAGR